MTSFSRSRTRRALQTCPTRAVTAFGNFSTVEPPGSLGTDASEVLS